MTRVARWRRSFEGSFAARHWPLIALVLVTLAAALVRMVGVDRLPPGLHGDEALTGLDARRIRDEGWIGPYVESARGQPTGPLYWVALVTMPFGISVTSIREAMAFLGVLTVPLAFGAFALMFDRRIAAVGALILAFLAWHVHLSRTAFLVTAWPVVEMAFMAALFLAIRTRNPLLYAVAGAILGVGFYTYNAFPVFAAPALLLVALVPVFQRPALTTALKVLLVPAVAALVALPLARFALDPDNDYLDHHRFVAVSESDDWQDAGLAERVRILAGNADEYARAVFFEARPDSVDGTNTSPLLDPITAVLVIAGGVAVVAMIVRARDPAQRLAGIAVVLMVLAIPAASVLTGDGHARRTLGITPFVAVLAALGLVGGYDLARARYPQWRHAALMAGALLLSCLVALNLYAYFVTFSRSDTADFVYAADFNDAATWIEDNAGDGAYVYFYSARWSVKYEPMRLIAPDVQGEDRSMEFSPFADYYRETLGDVTFVNERQGPVVWVLLDEYRGRAGDVAALYPQGELFSGPTRNGEPSFRAYTLPTAQPGNVAGGAP